MIVMSRLVFRALKCLAVLNSRVLEASSFCPPMTPTLEGSVLPNGRVHTFDSASGIP